MSETNIERLKAALNLDREPFSDEGVTGLFFPGGGRQQLAEQVIHLCRYGPPLLVLLGENGAGKSTLIRQVEERFDPSVFQWVHIEADVLADENLLLKRIEEQFQLDLGQDAETAIQTLIRYARELDGFSQTPLIIVDEAQNLSPSAIEFLQQLLSPAARSGLRCLLSMDGVSPEKIPLLKPLLQSEQESQVLEVPPLDAASVEAYVDYRMTTSGLSDIQFSADQKRQILNQSMGNIDRINIAARQILVEHFPYEKNRKKPIRLPLLHGIVVAVLAVFLLLAYWLVPEFSSQGQGPLELSGLPHNGGESDIPRLPESDKRVSDRALADSSKKKEEPSPDSGQKPFEPAETNRETAYESGPGANEVETSLDSFAAEEGSAQVDFNYAEQDTSDDPLRPVTVNNEQAPTEAEKPKSTVAKESAKVDKKPAKVVAEKSKPSQKSAGLSPREKWLMSLDKGKYTLQMLGASEEASVQKFLARYPSLKEIAYYRTTHRNQDWYVVVYGLFSSKESAKQELTKLPKTLQASGPWARSIASVQEEIEKRD